MNNKIVSVRVTLYFAQNPQLTDGAPVDGYGADAANETLRELQRSFTPGSDLLDYEVHDSELIALPHSLSEFVEGDFAKAKSAINSELCGTPLMDIADELVVVTEGTFRTVGFLDKPSGILISDPFSSTCGRFVAAPTTTYGISLAAARALKSLNFKIRELSSGMLTESTRQIQELLGVTSGDFAEMYFTGEKEDRFFEQHTELLASYAIAELQHLSLSHEQIISTTKTSEKGGAT